MGTCVVAAEKAVEECRLGEVYESNGHHDEGGDASHAHSDVDEAGYDSPSCGVVLGWKEIHQSTRKPGGSQESECFVR